MTLFDAGDRWPGNLPAESTSFVGRQAELTEIGQFLDHDRLVTLTGVGGVGKTRLAQRAGAEVRSGFPDGVWLVELSPLSAAAPIVLAVYEALRLADHSARSAMEVVADWLADKRLLLVLDCCEHLVTDCADVVEALLAAAPDVRIMTTSRRPLGLPDERVLPVPPLPVTAHGGHGDSADSEAAQLFLQRAADTVPWRIAPEEDGAVVGEICARLEGIPLAIELAAARLPEMPLGLLRRRLHSRFDTLTTPLAAQDARHGDGEPRHQALRTTIGWSHELCDPLERLLWARLSVFAGGFEQEAAESICAGGPLDARQVPRLLSRLVDRSIVQRTITPRGPRYALLDTVREYGGQWLRELDEERSTRRRHRDHYLRLARRGCEEWTGPDQALWCERAVAEHADMRAAMDFCLTEPDRRTALDLAGCLGFLWRHCGFHRDGQRYLDLVLEPDPAPGSERTWAFFARGSLAIVQADLEAAGRWGAACAAAAREPGQEDPGAAAAGAALVGMSLALRGDYARAAEVLDAVTHEPARDVRYATAPLQVRLGRSYAHVFQGEFARGRAVADALCAECRRYGERWVRSYADYLRARIDLAQGDPVSAARHARTALDGHWRLHNVNGAAVVLDGLASAVMAAGDGEQAAWLLGLGQRLWQTVGSAQMDSPDLVAVRRTCERNARQALGDTAYEAAFRRGLESGLDDGLAAARRPR